MSDPEIFAVGWSVSNGSGPQLRSTAEAAGLLQIVSERIEFPLWTLFIVQTLFLV
jgi:hypothetical protein